MKELISRQAAINDAESWVAVDEYEKHLQKNVVEWLKEFPSAQPEIIRCKDCKHYWIHKCMDSMPLERCDLEQTFYDPDRDFCSRAERREVTT